MTFPKALFLAAIAALATSACSTVEGIGKDVQSAGQAVERAAERTSRAISD